MTDSHTSRLESALAGRYRIERKLGEGGMASVFLAEDLKHERKVALKILKPELAAVIGAERFLAEIKTTANLQHPHILPLFDSGEAEGFLYYVMPFIDGETLRSRIDREGQLGVEDAVRIAKNVADALDYAHRNDVIHRDIKPANILLHDGRPVVADFGIALAISAAGGGRMTETGLSLGTPHYMSPEQASADRDLSARSDVYSLGCVLYEMLAGQPPHTGPSAQNILVRILTEDPRNVTELRRTVPPHVASTVMKSIEKLPADRFDTAREFMDALEDEGFSYTPAARAPHTSVTAAPAPAPVGGSGSKRVSPLALTALAVVALGVGGVLGRVLSGPGPDPQPATLARLDFGDLTVDGVAKVVISPEGDRLAVVTNDGGDRSIWVRNVGEEHFRLLIDGGDPSWPAFSPDGEWIVYEDNNALMRVALSGGAPRPVVPASAGLSPFQPTWGDQGTVVFEADDRLYRVPETGGEPVVLVEGMGSITNPRLLPGESGVLFSIAGDFNSHYLNLGTGEVREIIPGGIAPVYTESGHVVYVDQQGGLWAAPFDAAAGEVTGEATPILEGIVVRFDRFARFDVSRNGTLVYGLGLSIGGGGQPLREFLVVSLGGEEETIPLDPRSIDAPRWSPDGEWVAYGGTEAGRSTDARMVYVYNVELGTTPRRLTFAGGTNTGPVWSPDGTRIAFASQREGTDGRDLFIKSVNDDSPPEFLLGGPGRQTPRQWFPDDLLLYQTGQSAGQNDLWLIDVADTASSRPYLAAEGNRVAGYVSPQGDLAAYESDESGDSEVYVRSFPEARQPTSVSSGGGRRPRWSPDGETLYYWRPLPGPAPDSLFAARVQREPTFAVLSTDFVLAGDYDGFNWDLHPDGDRFITVRLARGGTTSGDTDASGEPERHLIVTNWFTELLASAGEGR
jgi:serine/threonine-protein kinase